MAKQESFDTSKFEEVCKLNHKRQAIFFLNAYWAEHGADAENIWKMQSKFVELDSGNQEGTALDEFNSHRLLELFGEPLTVIQFREAFKALDQNFDKKMGVVEYLVWRYKLQVKELLSRPQGTNEELQKAEEGLKKVQDEINKIEEQKKKLEELAAGEGFKSIKAKNELAQLLSQDNLPLNKALIDAKLAVKKAQKSEGVAAQGALWWVSRELEEAQKYKPKSNLKTSFH